MSDSSRFLYKIASNPKNDKKIGGKLSESAPVEVQVTASMIEYWASCTSTGSNLNIRKTISCTLAEVKLSNDPVIENGWVPNIDNDHIIYVLYAVAAEI